jgi:hypothetical protein
VLLIFGPKFIGGRRRLLSNVICKEKGMNESKCKVHLRVNHPREILDFLYILATYIEKHFNYLGEKMNLSKSEILFFMLGKTKPKRDFCSLKSCRERFV